MFGWWKNLFRRDTPTKASAGVLTQAPGGLGTTPSLSRAQEQYRHNVGWAYVATRAIAWRIAGQDVCVGRIGRRGKNSVKALGDTVTPLDTHPLLDAIANPNPIMTRWPLMVSTVSSLDLTGRSYWWMPDGNDRPEIWPLPSDWVMAADPMRGSYFVTPPGTGQKFQVPADQMAAFVLPDPSDPFGSKSPLQSQAPAVAADEAIQVAQARGFSNGLFPGLLIRVGRQEGIDGKESMRPTLTPAQRKDLIESLRTLHEGAVNYGEPLIVDGQIEGVDRLTNTVQEMDFLGSGKMTKSRIMQAFGVNPLIVGEIEGSNKAQAVVAERVFTASTVNPLIQLLSESMTRWVVPRFADRERLVAWITPAVADDDELNLQRWGLGLKSGCVTVNEFRARVLNLPPVTGGDEPSGNAAIWRALGGA